MRLIKIDSDYGSGSMYRETAMSRKAYKKGRDRPIV